MEIFLHTIFYIQNDSHDTGICSQDLSIPDPLAMLTWQLQGQNYNWFDDNNWRQLRKVLEYYTPLGEAWKIHHMQILRKCALHNLQFSMTLAPPPPLFLKSLMALATLIFCLPQHCWVWAWETFTQSCYISNWRAIRISATNKWVRSYLCNHQSNILGVSGCKTELSQNFLALPKPFGLDTLDLDLPAWGSVSRIGYFLLFQ